MNKKQKKELFTKWFWVLVLRLVLITVVLVALGKVIYLYTKPPVPYPYAKLTEIGRFPFKPPADLEKHGVMYMIKFGSEIERRLSESGVLFEYEFENKPYVICYGCEITYLRYDLVSRHMPDFFSGNHVYDADLYSLDNQHISTIYKTDENVIMYGPCRDSVPERPLVKHIHVEVPQ